MPGSAPPIPTVVEVVTQVVYYLSLSLPLGIGLTVGVLAIPESHGGLVARHARTVALPAALVVVLGCVLQFVATATHSTPSPVELIQLVGLVLAAAALLAMRRTPSQLLARGVAIAAVIVALIPEVPLQSAALSRVASNVLTAVHVLGAITWVGGLVVLTATAIAARRIGAAAIDKGRAAAEWAQIWERFSLVALFSVGALIVSGTWLAWSHVGTASQFFTTAYGRFLGIKLVLVITLLGAGAYNMRVLLPRIHALRQDGDNNSLFHIAAQHFPKVVFGEALLSIGVLVVVPFLRGSARSEAGWPSAAPFDLSTFATGLVLVILVAAGMWLGTRRSSKPLQPSKPRP